MSRRSFPATRDPIELADSGDRRVALYGRDGARGSPGPVPGMPTPSCAGALRGDVRDDEVGGFLVVGTPVTRGERVVGALRAAVPQSVVTDRTRDAILLMVGIGALAVGDQRAHRDLPVPSPRPPGRPPG